MRQVTWFTRIAATVAVATQTVLLVMAVTLAVHDQRPIADVAGRQGAIFATTVLLAAAVFKLNAAPRPIPQVQIPQTQTGVRHG